MFTLHLYVFIFIYVLALLKLQVAMQSLTAMGCLFHTLMHISSLFHVLLAMMPAPRIRSHVAQPTSDTLLVFGGTTCAPENAVNITTSLLSCNNSELRLLNDTWLLNITTMAWTQVGCCVLVLCALIRFFRNLCPDDCVAVVLSMFA